MLFFPLGITRISSGGQKNCALWGADFGAINNGSDLWGGQPEKQKSRPVHLLVLDEGNELGDGGDDRGRQDAGWEHGQHIRGRDRGGSRGGSDLQLLCSTCHPQVIQVLELGSQKFNCYPWIWPGPDIPFVQQDGTFQQFGNRWDC